jgi:hypothetical protein
MLEKQHSNPTKEKFSMCPVCATTMALLVASATSTCGLGALAAKKMRTKGNADQPNQLNSTEHLQ